MLDEGVLPALSARGEYKRVICKSLRVHLSAVSHGVASSRRPTKRVVCETSVEGIHDNDEDEDSERIALTHRRTDGEWFRESMSAAHTDAGAIKGGYYILCKRVEHAKAPTRRDNGEPLPRVKGLANAQSQRPCPESKALRIS